MAQIRDVRLQLGMNQEFHRQADVTFAVEFSQAEVNQNINFGLYVALLNYDPRVMQQYRQSAQNGAYEFGTYPHGQGNGWNPTLNRDNGVMWVAREVIRSNGTKTQFFHRKVSFQRNQNGNGFWSQNGNNDQFIAHVNVIPEITEGRGWSNPFRMGQGQMPFMHQHNGQEHFQPEMQQNGAYASNLI